MAPSSNTKPQSVIMQTTGSLQAKSPQCDKEVSSLPGGLKTLQPFVAQAIGHPTTKTEGGPVNPTISDTISDTYPGT